jgi:hypothetical protein
MTKQDISDDECTCDQPSSICLKRLLIHGVIVECNSCGGLIKRIGDGTILDQLVAELSPPESELEVTIPRYAWEHGEQ